MSEISSLKDHLSKLVGYSSPKSPEEVLWAERTGVGGGGGGGRRCKKTEKKVSLQILQI